MNIWYLNKYINMLVSCAAEGINKPDLSETRTRTSLKFIDPQRSAHTKSQILEVWASHKLKTAGDKRLTARSGIKLSFEREFECNLLISGVCINVYMTCMGFISAFEYLFCVLYKSSTLQVLCCKKTIVFGSLFSVYPV